jgi:acetyl-CoA/propionyl-CoA carboxylase biotin carboxyl carrier protein
MTVPQAFDSLLAKLIVTGATREQALERSRRALAEFDVGGMPTVLPFHQAVLHDEAFTAKPFSVHTRWIETEFAGDIPPWSPEADEAAGAAEPAGAAGAGARERFVVEVGGKRLDVVLPAGLGVAAGGGASPGAAGRGDARPRSRRAKQAASAGGDALTSPMLGTIVKIVASEGQRVSAGDTVVVLEAMKMEQPLTAHKDGTVTGLAVEIGQTVSAGTTVCRLAD